MNKQIEVLNVLQSEYKLQLQLKTLEINQALNTSSPFDNIEDLRLSIESYTSIQARLQVVQRIKDQILKGQEENED
jgi:hypothetical protein